MVNRKELEEVYKENLEESIIAYISRKNKITLEAAMDIFYTSELSKQISEGKFGIENLDYKYLAEDLMTNESSLFNNQSK